MIGPLTPYLTSFTAEMNLSILSTSFLPAAFDAAGDVDRIRTDQPHGPGDVVGRQAAGED